MDPVQGRKMSTDLTPMDVDDDAPSPSIPSSLSHPDDVADSYACPLVTMSSPSSPPVTVPQETEGVLGIRGLTRRDIFCSQLPILEPTSRKRKRADDAPYPDAAWEDDPFRGSRSNPPPSRRSRRRLPEREDLEFSPLLIMSPRQEPCEEEEMVLALHYPPNPTGSSIQRYFQVGNPPEHGPSVSQSNSLSEVDCLDDRGRSDSADSLAEVALASVGAPKRRRLSALQDIRLPRPFEDAKQPLSPGFLVHERGFGAGPLFFSNRPGRMVTGEPGGSQRFVMPSLDMGFSRYFDKPLCESPDSIDPVDGYLAHAGVPSIRVTTQHDSPGSKCSSHDGRQ